MNFSLYKRCAALAAGAFLLTGVPALIAQSYQGGLRGIISDSGGGVVANAKATLTDEATGSTRATLTNDGGEYVFNAVNPSTYTLVIEAPSFKRLERRGVIVATQQFITLDLSLELGKVSESVTVTEEVPLIESSTASNGQVIDNQKMADLPNLGRNPFLLSKLAANVTPVGDPRFNRFQDQSGSSQITIAGGPVRGNNYLIDGVPITDFNNRAVIIPSIEAVQEMKLQVNTYDAEMGRTGGGVFNAYLKSGTNDVHGSVFGYTRQADWLANSFFLNRQGVARPDTPFYNYGASFGGPVWVPKVYNGKNRTFFWMAVEGYRQKSSLSQDLSLPTMAERTGDFSHTLNSSGGLLTIYDPLSGNPRLPFAGNKIPAGRMDPAGLKIASYYPAPQRDVSKYGAANFTGSDILTDRADELTSKVDHQFTSWWRANASYLHYGSKEPSGNLLGTLPGSQSNLLFRKVDATQVNNLLTPNPTTVISVRYGFNRFPNDTRELSAGFNPSSLGLPYGSSIQALAFPDFKFQNLAELGGTSTSSGVFHSKNFLVSVSKFMGRHSLKAGFDYRKINVDFIDLSTAPGTFSFDDTFTRANPTKGGDGTGSDLASLLLGYASGGSVQTSTKLYTNVHYYAGYVHDDIRFSSKLSLNVGVRYEWETGIGETNDNYVVGFDRNAASPLLAGTPNQPKGVLMFAGQNGSPTTCCNPSGTKFSPRLGAAYSLDSKTTLRGGYGVFYAPTRYALDASLAPGYTQQTSYIFSNDGGVTPAASLANPFPNGIQKPVGNTLGGLTGIGSSISFLDQNRGTGIVHQFSFDVQRELPGNIAVQAGYVGSRSNHLQTSSTANGLINVNQLAPNYLALGSSLLDKVANPFYGNGGTGVIGAATVTRSQLLRPFPQYASVNAATDLNHARYDALVLRAQKRLSKGLTFLGTYTWSKNYDASFASGNFLNGSASSAQNIYNLDSEYGLSIVDTPHRFVINTSYELPFGKGKTYLAHNRPLDYVVGGWQINAIGAYQSGFPLAITQSSNLNSVIGAGVQRPNATGVSPVVTGSVQDRLDGYINKAAFTQAPQFTFGNLARTIGYRGPGQKNWDLSLFKNVNVTERVHGQFRAEALNAFNTPQFRGPNTSFGSSSFGVITQQANFPRYLQLGFRVYF